MLRRTSDYGEDRPLRKSREPLNEAEETVTEQCQNEHSHSFSVTSKKNGNGFSNGSHSLCAAKGLWRCAVPAVKKIPHYGERLFTCIPWTHSLKVDGDGSPRAVRPVFLDSRVQPSYDKVLETHGLQVKLFGEESLTTLCPLSASVSMMLSMKWT